MKKSVRIVQYEPKVRLILMNFEIERVSANTNALSRNRIKV